MGRAPSLYLSPSPRWTPPARLWRVDSPLGFEEDILIVSEGKMAPFTHDFRKAQQRMPAIPVNIQSMNFTWQATGKVEGKGHQTKHLLLAQVMEEPPLVVLVVVTGISNHNRMYLPALTEQKRSPVLITLGKAANTLQNLAEKANWMKGNQPGLYFEIFKAVLIDR
ncbi:hypothetical protein L345_15847, partial [Ophiophagus hannah]